ncbi:MAG: RHS repeat-associated core domain-containing protein [Dysgonomonas sp.]
MKKIIFLLLVSLFFSKACFSQIMQDKQGVKTWVVFQDSISNNFLNKVDIPQIKDDNLLQIESEKRRIEASQQLRTVNAIIPEFLTIDSAKVEKPVVQKMLKSAYYGQEIQPHIPKSFTVDKTKDIGEINIHSSTSPTGAMILSVPIEIAPNPKKFQPEISLVYNSMAGNRELGIGWSIGSISKINKTNKSIYYDGSTNGYTIDATGKDAFLLDGKRLIVTSSQYPQTVTFQTEQDNIKVIGYIKSFLIYYYDYFEVYYPNGTVATYGTPNAISFLQEFPLTKITNASGDVINYSYTITNNIQRLDKITYGQSQQAAINFIYSTGRADIQKYYECGSAFACDFLLRNITTSQNGVTLRSYTLDYSTKGSASALTSIGCTAAEKSYNPINFYYGDNKQISSIKKADTQLMYWYNYTYAWQLRTTKGKFDYGSESEGIITLPHKSNYAEYYKSGGLFNHSKNYIYNEYAGDESIFISTGLNGTLAGICPTLKTETGFVDIFCVDLDDYDGEEIVKVNNTISGSQEKVDFHVYTPNLYAGIAKKYTRTFYFNTLLDYRGDKSISPKFYYVGDFNGDGKMDVMAISTCNVVSSGNKSTIYIFDLENNKILYQGNVFDYYVQYSGGDANKNSDKLYTIDYNGDGKTDLCLINGTGTHVYTFDINGSVFTPRHVSTYSSLTKNTLIDRDFLQGEFNGDGKSDFILSPAKGGGSTWKIYASNGSGSFNETDVSITTKIESSRFLTQDMNGDGQTDIIETYGSSDTQTLASYFISNMKYIGSSSTSVPKESIIIPTSISERNYFNQLISLRNGIATRIAYQTDISKLRLLTGYVNSFGVVSKFEYCQLNQDNYGMLYNKGYGAKYPYQNYYGGMTVLSASETYNNNVKTAGNYYTYSNGIMHLQGLGFRGFEKMTSQNTITGEYITQTYDPFNFSVLKAEDSNKASSSLEYSISVASNKVAKVLLSKKTIKDKLKNTTITSTYTYDTYCNPTKEILDYGDGVKMTTTSTFNNLTGAPYILGQLNTQTLTSERSGATAINTKLVMTYNTTGQPLTEKTYYNNNLVSDKAYVYDARGNITEEKVKAYSSTTWLTSKYTYDTYGNVTKETDPLGLTKDYTYNSPGKLTSIKNHKGHETKIEYDSWQREIKVTNPDGTIKTTSLAWASSPTEALILLTEVETGTPSSQTYYNALGKEVRKGTMRFDGQYQYTDIAYDNRNRIQKVSLPFKGTAPTLWNAYNYDTYDRLTSLVYASGKKDTYSYTNTSVTETIDNVARTVKEDAAGNIISVTDLAGTITYTLRADGKPSSVIAPGDVKTTFEYDAYGRQTKIIDPSAGTKLFAYDAAGNISQETDARNKVIKSTYDVYNRITRLEVVGDIVSTYTYNTDGQLTSVTGNNGTGKTYTYDALMRLSVEKENIPDNKWLQKDYIYSGGNIGSITFTSNTGKIGSENYTYTNGSLVEIKLNNTTSIWKLTKENDLGLATEASTGTLTNTYGYDAYGMPTARAIKNGNTFIQNFTYSFNAATRNLSWRKDNNRNLQENFTYDNLNRLVGYAGKTVSYDIKGNITNISSIGAFFYGNTSKPYAVTQVALSGNSIPLHQQLITYNGMMRPATITENNYAATFTYNSDGDRVKMHVKKNNADELLRYYIGDRYEVDAGVAGAKERLYLGGDAYSAAAVYVKEGTGAWTIYYLGRDYLGSITHIINTNGSVKQEISYDAWGNLRNPSNQQNYALGSEPVLFLGRGYTGHEHLVMFGLVNMNARLYDSALGRFLSPDPFVQAPLHSQNFNRFSYALNNPLRYTDPSGEFLHIVVGGLIGGVINWVSNGCQFNAKGLGYFGAGAASGMLTAALGPAGAAIGGAIVGAANTALAGGSLQDIAKNALIGGATGLVSGYVGQWASKALPLAINGTPIASPILKGMVGGAGGGAMTGFAGGFTAEMLTSGDINKAWKSGAKGAAMGAAIGAGTGAVSGYIQARKDNLNPITGKTLGNKGLESNLANKGLLTGNRENLNPEIVDKYYKQMVDGDFGLENAVGGFRHEGKIILTEGNHRMAAAVKYEMNFGSSKYVDQLLTKGRLDYNNPKDYGYPIRKIKIK